jgi:hypothetical protein
VATDKKHKDKTMVRQGEQGERHDWGDVQLTTLIDRAQRGNTAALGELSEAFARYPALLAQSVDMALQARIALLSQSSGGRDEFIEAVWLPKLKKMVRELLPADGTEATPLERLPIERVATC